MRNKIIRIISVICLVALLSCGALGNSVSADETVYLGGMPAGFTLNSRGAYVIGLCDVVGAERVSSPAKTAGIVIGDVILKVNGADTDSAKDIGDKLTENRAVLTVKRKDSLFETEVQPVKDVSGKFKLGLFIRNTVNGIGTVTFVKHGKIASLGHPVLSENNEIMEIKGGRIFKCTVTGCVRGEKGKAGELKGNFYYMPEIASVSRNSVTGVYGAVGEGALDYSLLRATEIGSMAEAKQGAASIFTTIDGTEPAEYSVSVVKTDASNPDNKNFVIKITDERLLESTGGIVQGMSGSPLVQNGKLIGAVTHVFLNDPTRGFAIGIEKMLAE